MSGNRSAVSQPEHRDSVPRASDASLSAICSGANFSIYVLRELLGVGNTASVYRAHDTRLRREVALKVLNGGALTGADGLARFLHEARMAAAVRHANVVSIFDVGVHDGTPYIVMELLNGEDLDVRLNAARVLREPVVVDIAVQLVSGLAAVHDAGVVHRDLRPSNVFLARGPGGSTQPKLLDFGVSKQTRDNLRLTTNGRRRWAAMPLYTAPEVLLDGVATFHSDQYSLGVLLYECVTGVNPFRADTPRESIELITAGQARRIRDQPVRPSWRLAAIIEKAMHVYPDRRFADLRELGHALAGVSGRRAAWPWSPRPAVAVTRAPSPKRSPMRRAPLVRAAHPRERLSWAIGATVIGFSIGAPIVAWWSAHRQRAPVSVTSPLTAGGGSTPIAALGASPCAVPCVASSGGQALPASVDGAAHTSIAPLQAAPLPPFEIASPPPERAAPPTSEAAPPPAPAVSTLPTEFAEVEQPEERAPGGPAPLLAPPAPDAVSLDAGAGPRDAGGEFAPRDPAGLPLPRLAAPQSRHERGTNGALIFD